MEYATVAVNPSPVAVPSGRRDNPEYSFSEFAKTGAPRFSDSPTIHAIEKHDPADG